MWAPSVGCLRSRPRWPNSSQLKHWLPSSTIVCCFAGGLLLPAAVLVVSIDFEPAFGRVVLRSPLDVLSASFWPIFLPPSVANADVCLFISSYSPVAFNAAVWFGGPQYRH